MQDEATAPEPGRAAARRAEVAPVTVVIFGGAGDLAHRKLLPAIYNLHLDGALPANTAVVGVGRKDLSDDQYREFARDGIAEFSRRPIAQDGWDAFARSLFFVNADLASEQGLASLGSRLDVIEHERGLAGNRIYYMAIPPSLFVPTVQQLAHGRFIGPVGQGPFSRLIIEKPIGHDLKSAMEINDAIAAVFDEHQMFRIDHYLGKETVQNILVLRFANSFFEPLFNQKYIDHVQITVAEEEGVGTRAGYYDQSGALRDMLQNHMLQVLALVAMEPPHSLDPNVVRDEKLEVLQSLRPWTPETVDEFVVRAQYGAGSQNGTSFRAYGDEAGVKAGSTTETFVALEARIDNWRWSGVPFFLRTGKRLPVRASEISIQFKDVPPILFNRNRDSRLNANSIRIRLQPDEGFSLCISSKKPGPYVDISPVAMDFDYSDFFKMTSPEAYERLLLDVMAGDATLFMRRDSVEASWQWIMPILDRWSATHASALPAYGPGDWGPSEADALITRTGRAWRTL